MALRNMVLGAGLLSVALHSAALSLGATTAVPLIGRPLNITVPVVADGADDLCLQAEVLYADTPVAPALVTSRFEPAPGKRQGLIRLRSSKVVDEPVVTVEIGAGCKQRVTRRYVLLADVGDEVVLPALVPGESDPSPFVAPPSLALASPGGMRTSPGLPPRPRPTPANGTASGRTPTSVSNRGVEGAKSSARPPAKTAKGDRLRLMPADAAIERNPALKLSLELKAEAAGGAAERAAAAALWRVLNLDAEASLQGLEKIAAMETELRKLRATKAQEERATAALKAELAQAQSERYGNPLVYGLTALVLLLGGLLAGSWVRRRRQAAAPSWAPTGHGSLDPSSVTSSYLPAAEPTPTADPANTGIDLDMMASMFPETGDKPPDSSLAPANFGDSLSPSARGVMAEELLDMQQQVDFFVSLGQHDQAITVLRSHIGQAGVAGGERSPLAYLDLLRLYHLLNRREDYRQLREDFSQAFQFQVPEFDSYRHQSPGLQAHPETLSRIVVAWPRPAVLPLIEGLIFHRPDGHAEGFDLEACRDLLLLYAVAKERLADEGAALTV